MSSDFEQLRKKNLEDNKRILAELGLLNPFKPLPRVIKNKPVKRFKRKDEDEDYDPENEESGDEEVRRPVKKKPKYFISGVDDIEGYGSVTSGSRRRSSRLQGMEAPDEGELAEEIEQAIEAEEDGDVKKPPKNRPMVYGAIPDVEVGRYWDTRMQCNYDGIHRPTVAGIHGGPKGAYSIALSGGYDDNIDLGECFTYTGEGGRDLKGTTAKPKNLRTAPQSKDQKLSKGNQALVTSVETGFPVRVIRGYKLAPFSPYAPEEGYRYDGLYKVEKWWYTTGAAGFGVYRFALKRLPDQAPPPWEYKEDGDEGGPVGSQDSGIGSEAPPDLHSDSSNASSEDSHENSGKIDSGPDKIQIKEESKDHSEQESETRTESSTEEKEKSNVPSKEISQVKDENQKPEDETVAQIPSNEQKEETPEQHVAQIPSSEQKEGTPEQQVTKQETVSKPGCSSTKKAKDGRKVLVQTNMMKFFTLNNNNNNNKEKITVSESDKDSLQTTTC